MSNQKQSGLDYFEDELKQIEEERAARINALIEAAYREMGRKKHEDMVRHALLAHYLLCTEEYHDWPVVVGLVPYSEESPNQWWIGEFASQVKYDILDAVDRFPDSVYDFQEFWELCRGSGVNFEKYIVDRLFSPYARPKRYVLESLAHLEDAAEKQGLAEEPEPTHRIGEDFEESPLHEFWQKRRRQGRIVTAIIVARDGETGVGKTTLGVALCKEFDDDWTADRATNRPWEYRGLVQSEPKGSVLLADEFATMFDARRSMSSGNVESSQDWQMLRKLEVSTVGTCPSMADVDRRFLRLMDLQFLVTRRGHARVYKMKINDDDGSLYREHMCNVEWPDLSDDEDYQAVETMKEERLSERLDGDDDRDDQDDQEVSDEQRREVRNEVVRKLVEEGVTQAEVAEALDLSPSAVSRIVNE